MLLQYLSCFLVLLFLTYCVKLLLKYFKLRDIINRIPGPLPRFLIGNIFDIMGTPEQMFHIQRQLASKYKICRLWMGQLHYVVLIHLPEDIEVVISSTNNMAKSKAYKCVEPWLKQGLLTSSGEKWRTTRKMLTPSFHFGILQQFIPIFFQHANILLTKLSHLDLNTKNGIDIVPYLISYALQTICETSMGTSFDEDNNMKDGYTEAIEEIGKLLVYRTLYPWLLYDWVYFFTPSYHKQKKILKTLHHISRTVLKNRKEYHTQSKTTKTENKKKLALLDLLLELKESGAIIDDEEIQEEVDTFIFAGHDTTGLSLSFTLMLLANYKNVQDTVYEEIKEVLGTSCNPPSYQDLQRLTYLEMCIKEALRLYPSVPFIARESSTDLVTATGYLIPKNTQIGISIYDLHRDPDWYPAPEKFNPERFLPENCTDRHRFAYLPFSGGPRNCIGQKFAMLEMKTLLSTVLMKYILEPVDTPESLVLTQDMVLKSKHGVRIKLIPRNDKL